MIAPDRILLVTITPESVFRKWSDRYPVGQRYGTDKDAIRERLESCSTLDECDQVIRDGKPAYGWTSVSCDLCKEYVTAYFTLGEEPDYEARWLNICLGCMVELAQTADMMNGINNATDEQGKIQKAGG